MKQLLFLSAIAATACTTKTQDNQPYDDNDTSLSISFGSGKISIANESIQGPSLRSDPAKFSLNGVHLYPGSKIIDQRVEIDRAGARTMRLSFESTTAAPTVREWFRPKLEKAGYSLSTQGDSLSGKDPRGHPFDLKISDQPSGTIGVIKERL